MPCHISFTKGLETATICCIAACKRQDQLILGISVQLLIDLDLWVLQLLVALQMLWQCDPWAEDLELNQYSAASEYHPHLLFSPICNKRYLSNTRCSSALPWQGSVISQTDRQTIKTGRQTDTETVIQV